MQNKYIPIKLYLKNRKEPLTINLSEDEAYLFQDWANENNVVADRFVHEKITVDDVITGSVFQIFRSHIQLIEYPFVCPAEPGAFIQGTFLISFDMYKKISKNKKHM